MSYWWQGEGLWAFDHRSHRQMSRWRESRCRKTTPWLDNEGNISTQPTTLSDVGKSYPFSSISPYGFHHITWSTTRLQNDLQNERANCSGQTAGNVAKCSNEPTNHGALRPRQPLTAEWGRREAGEWGPMSYQSQVTHVLPITGYLCPTNHRVPMSYQSHTETDHQNDITLGWTRRGVVYCFNSCREQSDEDSVRGHNCWKTTCSNEKVSLTRVLPFSSLDTQSCQLSEVQQILVACFIPTVSSFGWSRGGKLVMKS